MESFYPPEAYDFDPCKKHCMLKLSACYDRCLTNKCFDICDEMYDRCWSECEKKTRR